MPGSSSTSRVPRTPSTPSFGAGRTSSRSSPPPRSTSPDFSERQHPLRKPAMIHVGIIVGSTRPGRKADSVARWVHEIAKKRSDASFEVVDIADFNLPLLDEAMPPAMGQYSNPHTKVWAEKIAGFDAY